MGNVIGYGPIKARKPHGCDYCGEPVTVGRPYMRWAYLGNGYPETVRAHVECNAVACEHWRIVGTDDDERTVCSDPIDEWVSDAADGTYGDPVARESAIRAGLARLGLDAHEVDGFVSRNVEVSDE